MTPSVESQTLQTYPVSGVSLAHVYFGSQFSDLIVQPETRLCAYDLLLTPQFRRAKYL